MQLWPEPLLHIAHVVLSKYSSLRGILRSLTSPFKNILRPNPVGLNNMEYVKDMFRLVRVPIRFKGFMAKRT